MDFLTQAWNAVWTTAPPPSLWLVILAVTLGATPAFISPIWSYARHIVTLAHESGHAIVGVLTGRKLTGIKLHTDTSGVTATAGVGWGISGLLTTLAGYPAPAFIAAAILFGVMSGRANMTAAILCLILLGLLLFTRNLWGLVLTGGTIAVLGLSFTQTSTFITSILLLFIVGLLAAGSFRTLIEERAGRKRGVEGSDIAALAQRTLLPATAWWVIAFGLSAGWLVAAVWLAIL